MKKKSPFPFGMTTTLGAVIIGLAIVIVGVAIYFVYQSTQKDSEIEFVIIAQDAVTVQLGVETTIDALITSPRAGTIRIAASADEALQASITQQDVNPGDTAKIQLKGVAVAESSALTLTANQSGVVVKKTINVKVFSTGNANVNVSNTNATNVNQNVNVDRDHLRFTNGNMNITFLYPQEWGQVLTPELVRLKPITGNMYYNYFENLLSMVTTGRVYITAVTPNYTPSEWAGTPFWFAGTLTPEASEAQIIKQFSNVGITAFDVERVTIDGRNAVKAYLYRGYQHHFLDVAYAYPLQKNDQQYTVMILRTIEMIADGKAMEEPEALKLGATMTEQLQNNKLSEQAARRYSQLEELIESLQFIQ